MKKSLIAAAALAATGAFAQSTVTLYGVADVNYSFNKMKTGAVTTKTNGMGSGGLSGSRWGLKGSEDLGGGLKANFVYESAITLNNGTGNNAFGRSSWVGLSGGFGSISFGRQYTPYFSAVAMTLADGVTGYETNDLLDSVRADNSIQYKTPNFGGFSAAIALGSEKTSTAGVTSAKSDLVEAGVYYAAGPLGLTAALGQNKGLTSKAEYHAIGGTYDFGMAKLYANYLGNKMGAAKASELNLGVTMPFGPFSVVAEYGRDLKPFKANDFMIGANYALSKRTDVYGRLSSNKMGAALATATGRKDQFAMGLRHTF